MQRVWKRDGRWHGKWGVLKTYNGINWNNETRIEENLLNTSGSHSCLSTLSDSTSDTRTYACRELRISQGNESQVKVGKEKCDKSRQDRMMVYMQIIQCRHNMSDLSCSSMYHQLPLICTPQSIPRHVVYDVRHKMVSQTSTTPTTHWHALINTANTNTVTHGHMDTKTHTQMHKQTYIKYLESAE